MLCPCHGQQSYWNPDPKMLAGGHWRCAVKKREQQRRTDQARAVVKNERAREDYYNRGGWARRRRRALQKQRGEILERLQQLEREAAEC